MPNVHGRPRVEPVGEPAKGGRQSIPLRGAKPEVAPCRLCHHRPADCLGEFDGSVEQLLAVGVDHVEVLAQRVKDGSSDPAA